MQARQSTSTGAVDGLLTALAPIIWGSTYIVATEWLPADRPFTAAVLRTLPAGLLLMLASRRLPSWPQLPRLAVLAALNIGLFQALLFVAAYRLPGGLAAVVGAIQPLLVMALAWSVEGRRPRAVTVTAAAAGVAGMAALLLSPSASWDALGVAAAAGGAASMAAGTYLSRRWQSDMPVPAFTGWQLALGGLTVLPVALAVDPPLPTLTPSQVLAYGYLCGVGALLAYTLWFRGVARLPSVAMSSLGMLSPLTAVVLGWTLLGESMSGLSLVGLVTVLGSVLAVQLTTRPSPPSILSTVTQAR